MQCQAFNAPLGAKPVMTLLGPVQTTTLVMVLILFALDRVRWILHYINGIRQISESQIPVQEQIFMMQKAIYGYCKKQRESNKGVRTHLAIGR